MFPTYFDVRICAQAGTWLELGRPELTPIYSRNRVEVSFGTHSGQILFKPIHEEFILVNGREQRMEDFKDGWLSDVLTVNPSKWPDDPTSEDGSKVLVAVDPTLANRTRDMISDNEKEMRRNRANQAVRQAIRAWHKEFPSEAKSIRPSGAFDKGEVLVTESQIRYNTYDYFTCSWRMARYEVTSKDGPWTQGKIHYVGVFSRQDGGLKVGESSEFFSLKDVTLPATPDFDKKLSELQALIEKVEAEELAKEVSLDFPEVGPLETGYPVAKLPTKLSLNKPAGTLRSQGAMDSWFQSACKMAEALGYHQVYSTSSRTGRTESAEYVLPDPSNPKSLDRLIKDFDLESGVLYVDEGDVGRMIGRGGENIRKICKLTGRSWQVAVLTTKARYQCLRRELEDSTELDEAWGMYESWQFSEPEILEYMSGLK